MNLQDTGQEGSFLWCTGTLPTTGSNLTWPSVQKQWYSSDPPHTSAGCSFWSSGHLRCKDLQVMPAKPPQKITNVYMTRHQSQMPPPQQRYLDDGAVLRPGYGFTTPRGTMLGRFLQWNVLHAFWELQVCHFCSDAASTPTAMAPNWLYVHL